MLHRKDSWAQKWIIGGDFNDIREHEENEGENRRQESSFWSFRNFIADLKIGEVKFRGEFFTWVNNRENEGFIQESLDRFFGSVEWIIQFKTAEVCHIRRQASDHSLLILDLKPQKYKTKSRFIFDSR